MASNRRLTFEKSRAFSEKIERLIPGGAHTYSKGRDQFPAETPNGIVGGRGARVRDADGNELIDWSMGLTSVSLGHGWTVTAAIVDGVNFQRPAQLELEAAETFLRIVGTDMVKFARHGSVVNTAAVKLSRAHTGRALVAVPREHPFFSFDDWFIGITEADFGIPDEIKNFTVTFRYNDIDSLDALFRAHPDEIACVMMEPVKFDPPDDQFVHKAGELCARNGAVFVLDEMVTGLKFGVPGAAKYLDVEADLYSFGKGIANGFAATAVTGRGDIMRRGGLEPPGERKLFLLSTTHGSESVGLAAMMATMKLFESGDLVARNWRTGDDLRARLTKIVDRHGLSQHVKIIGYPCLMLMMTTGPDGQPDPAFQTLMLQEMIANGILFQGLFFPTPSHGSAELDDTESAFDRAAAVFRLAIDQGTTEGLLHGPAIKPVFRKNN